MLMKTGEKEAANEPTCAGVVLQPSAINSLQMRALTSFDRFFILDAVEKPGMLVI
jgi:hypothetical protein